MRQFPAVGCTPRHECADRVPLSLLQASSRSHGIFTITLECRPPDSDYVRTSKLHLVGFVVWMAHHTNPASCPLARPSLSLSYNRSTLPDKAASRPQCWEREEARACVIYARVCDRVPVNRWISLVRSACTRRCQRSPHGARGGTSTCRCTTWSRCCAGLAVVPNSRLCAPVCSSLLTVLSSGFPLCTHPQVILALHDRARGVKGHVPYRNSLMTSVLRDRCGAVGIWVLCQPGLLVTWAVSLSALVWFWFDLARGLVAHLPAWEAIAARYSSQRSTRSRIFWRNPCRRAGLHSGAAHCSKTWN